MTGPADSPLCAGCGERPAPPGRICGCCKLWILTRHRDKRTAHQQLVADLTKVGVDVDILPADLDVFELLHLLERALTAQLAGE